MESIWREVRWGGFTEERFLALAWLEQHKLSPGPRPTSSSPLGLSSFFLSFSFLYAFQLSKIFLTSQRTKEARRLSYYFPSTSSSSSSFYSETPCLTFVHDSTFHQQLLILRRVGKKERQE
jgi:hypothetical protein